MMDPKTQECLSRYLYGAGYYSRDQNTLGLIGANPTKTPPHFCLSCRLRAECEDAHEKRVRRIRPAEVEKFDRSMKRAVRRGVPPTLLARLLANRDGDPFAAVAVENFKEGHRDRGARAGTLVR